MAFPSSPLVCLVILKETCKLSNGLFCALRNEKYKSFPVSSWVFEIYSKKRETPQTALAQKESFFWIIFGYNWVWNCGFCLIGSKQTYLQTLKISKEKSLIRRLSCGESYEEISLVLHTSGVRYVLLFDKSAGLFCELQIKVVHSFLN